MKKHIFSTKTPFHYISDGHFKIGTGVAYPTSQKIISNLQKQNAIASMYFAFDLL